VLLGEDLIRMPERSDFDLVGIDQVAAGYLLADHLLKLGCKRLAFITHPKAAPSAAARIAGAIGALLQQHFEIDRRSLQIGDTTDLKFVRSLITGTDCDGLFCATEESARPLIQSLEATGIRVPQKIRVVGFDNVNHATSDHMRITCIQKPLREIAGIAFRAMMERIGEPTQPARHFTLSPRLIIGESCGAYPPRPTSRSGIKLPSISSVNSSLLPGAKF
jgi:DNA-binding LacI/PurR family transcriptional regulator